MTAASNDELDALAIESDARQGERVLNEAHAFLGRFVSYPSEHAQVAHALWCLHTHLMDQWESTPRLAFLSAEPASGKTRALEITELLVPNPVAAVNMSTAYLFRKVGGENGITLLYDEIDTVFGPKARDNEEIRALLNAGHRKGAVAGRCVTQGTLIKTEEIPAYAPVALAGVGWLPDTILTRSVIVRMRPRHDGERVEQYRRRVHAPQGYAIRDKLALWARSATIQWPELPGEIQDRDADVWEPLLAVADAVGGDWPSRARVAAVSLVLVSREAEASLGVRLLMDLRVIFGSDRELPSKVILDRLIALPESPWGDLRGKPLDDRGLAKRLRPYSVKPTTIRMGTTTPRGYLRADLEDQWRRYLPSSQESKTSKTSATVPAIAVSGVADVLHFPGEAGQHCEHCEKPGEVLRCDYGFATAWLHRECVDGWRGAYDKRAAGRLDIPEFLDRRNVQKG